MSIHVEKQGWYDESQAAGHVDVNAGDPQSGRDNNGDYLRNHDTFDHGKEVSRDAIKYCCKDPRSKIERHKLYVGIVCWIINKDMGRVGSKAREH